jgi:4-amino-4-deoxy-L-arabinose transferase-like glycosyltransferase
MSSIQNKLFIFLIVLCYIPILFLGLFDVDEGAFASTSLQMIKQKQYLIPIIGDELRLEKPILAYWVQVISMYIFGANEFALRLPSILASFIWAYSFSNFVKQHARNVHRTEIFQNLLTLPGVFIISSAATADAFLNVFITLLMINLFNYSLKNDDNLLVWSGIYVAFGFLTKGLTIIAICGTVSLIYFLLIRQISNFFKILFSWRAWLAFSLIVLPWFISILREMNFSDLNYLFFGQTIGRFTNTFEGHEGPFFYYIIALPFLILPYLIDALKGTAKLNLRGNNFELFLFVWFIFVLIFFSLSSTKLPHYMLYGITPLAYFIHKNHLIISRSKMSISSTLFHSGVWIFILSIPFYLNYLLSIQPSFEVSSSAINNFSNDFTYLAPAVCLIGFFIVSYFLGMRLLVVKRISAVALVAMLGFKILPIVNDATQADIKKIALDAKELKRDVSMFRLNKPSFAFYADLISYRDLQDADLIFTRVDKLIFLEVEYKIISKQGDYVLLETFK